MDDIYNAIEYTAGELPSGIIINISIENGAAWVEWVDANGTHHDIDLSFSDMSIDEQIKYAVKLATEGADRGA